MTTAPLTTLRPARQADRTAIEALLVQAGLPLDGVAEALDTFVVAEADGGIVGVAGLEVCRDHGLLRSVAVSPEWRSHGLGNRLVDQVIVEARSRGLHRLYLLTTTAERWFPKFGFRPIARADLPDDVRETEEFRSACPATATAMVRPVMGMSESGPATGADRANVV